VSDFGYPIVRDHGAVAQLGERLNGIQEVGGSTPLSSTPRLLAMNAAPAA
jgi:hypothetical protein